MGTFGQRNKDPCPHGGGEVYLLLGRFYPWVLECRFVMEQHVSCGRIPKSHPYLALGCSPHSLLAFNL
ncbi:conserved hypothetical protein [Ricinus communis]|uniref:Uncharacterized protein n=1 Tax=Ricinus communis TaxID=3988 RepID=B9SNX9_RICCO|nr:conserved hypothetical protein [Ricinus communis]